MKIIAMIPARMGSQRLKKKNLKKIGGVPLIQLAVRKAKASGVFDEVWVNSEDIEFKKIADKEKVYFHHRPRKLSSNKATSEEYIYEFLANHYCDYLVQIHSIAPLLKQSEIKDFVNKFVKSAYDVLLSGVEEQIECMLRNKPVNFSFKTKTNSQKLKPVQRITWSITGFNRKKYIRAIEDNKCATFYGKVGFFPLSRPAGHIIKTESDLLLARSLWKNC